MSDYISIGNLATDLKTNSLKIGKIIDSLKIERKRVKQGEWYNMCIAVANVDKIKEVVKNFRADQTRGKTAPGYKPIKHYIGDNSDGLFVNPIIIQDFRTGEISGQGLEAYWGKMEGSKL